MRKALPVALAALLLSAPVRAAGPAPQLSRYEQESLDGALRRIKGEIDPSPAGKVLEGVEVVNLDVFEPRDFIPTLLLDFVNFFHVTSRPYTLEREVLLPKGQRWDQALIDETARNLRQVRQLSLALCVPIRGSAPDRVKLLLVAKDVWSLRINENFVVAGGQLVSLLIQPSEENFFGSHQSVLGLFVLDQGRYTFGGQYIVPRVAGSRIGASGAANVFVNRATGKLEGSYGTFSYGQPLYSNEAEWAWEGRIDWRTEITRRFQGANLRTFDGTLAAGPSSPGERALGATEIPYVYKTDTVSGHYQVTRSYGSSVKHDLTFGFGANRRVYRAPDLTAFDPAASAEFVAQVLPVNDTQIGPYISYHTHANRYVSLLDVNRLGLQEDFLLGHDAYLQLYPVTTALRSSRNFFGVYAAASYTATYLRDGLARAFVESTTEVADDFPDASIDVGGRVVSPRTPIGRFILDARTLSRYRNYLNIHSFLGGDTRPRGYPTNAFVGKDMAQGSFELRSRAAQILSCQLGGAAFFDAGDAFDGYSKMNLKYGAGLGARIFFPQLDQIVLRVDWGFPLNPGYLKPGAFPGDIVFTFDQAFPMPGVPTKD